MPSAVVTGGAGFLGSHLCDYLIARDFRVVCVDNLDTGSLQNVEHLRGGNFEFRNPSKSTADSGCSSPSDLELETAGCEKCRFKALPEPQSTSSKSVFAYS